MGNVTGLLEKLLRPRTRGVDWLIYHGHPYPVLPLRLLVGPDSSPLRHRPRISLDSVHLLFLRLLIPVPRNWRPRHLQWGIPSRTSQYEPVTGREGVPTPITRSVPYHPRPSPGLDITGYTVGGRCPPTTRGVYTDGFNSTRFSSFECGLCLPHCTFSYILYKNYQK